MHYVILYVYIYIYVYVCMYVCIYIYIYLVGRKGSGVGRALSTFIGWSFTGHILSKFIPSKVFVRQHRTNKASIIGNNGERGSAPKGGRHSAILCSAPGCLAPFLVLPAGNNKTSHSFFIQWSFSIFLSNGLYPMVFFIQLLLSNFFLSLSFFVCAVTA